MTADPSLQIKAVLGCAIVLRVGVIVMGIANAPPDNSSKKPNMVSTSPSPSPTATPVLVPPAKESPAKRVDWEQLVEEARGVSEQWQQYAHSLAARPSVTALVRLPNDAKLTELLKFALTDEERFKIYDKWGRAWRTYVLRH